MEKTLKIKTQESITAELANYHGTDNYYVHRSPISGKPRGVYTDGVKRMAELCGAYWLIDVIFAAQINAQPECRYQLWEFWRERKDVGVLRCKDEAGNQIYMDVVEFTDFPLDSIKLLLEAGWIPDPGPVESKVLMLMGER